MKAPCGWPEPPYYDMASQLTSQTDYNTGISYPYTIGHNYDLEGKETKLGYGGLTNDISYDSAGKVKSVTRNGRTLSLGYNESGAPVRMSRTNAADSFISYDPLGRTTSISHLKSTGSVLGENRYGYDANGNITSHYATGSGTTAYSYDNTDRLKSWADSVSGGTYGYSYDAGDNAASVTVDSKNKLSRNQATVETDTSGFVARGAVLTRATTEQWQGASSLKMVTDGAGGYQGTEMTITGLPSSQTYTASTYVKGSGTVYLAMYECDSAGNFIDQTYAAPIALTGSWQRLSTANPFTSSGTRAMLFVITNGTPQVVTFYADGLQLEQAASAGSFELPSGTLKSFTHDAADQITTYQDSSTGATNSYNFTYDTEGNLSSDGQASFAWDGGGRLTQRVATGVTSSYSYGPEGYRTMKSVKTANFLSPNQATIETDTTGYEPYGTATIARNASTSYQGSSSLRIVTGGLGQHGSRTQTLYVTPSKTYTASAYVKGSGSMMFSLIEYTSADAYVSESGTYNINLTGSWQRVSVTRTLGATGAHARVYLRASNASVVTIDADALQLEEKSSASPFIIPDNSDTYFHWNGAQMLSETNSTGGVLAAYTYLPGDYAPYSMTTSAGTYYYLKNARGDVTALTDTTGTVVAKYRYDPWGSILATTDGSGADVSGNPSHIANVNPWRYAGYYFDKESGMYYLQARYYRADLMRFISVDSVCGCKTNNPLSEDKYAYAANNPVMTVDPYGQWVLAAIGALGIIAYWGVSSHYARKCDEAKDTIVSAGKTAFRLTEDQIYRFLYKKSKGKAAFASSNRLKYVKRRWPKTWKKFNKYCPAAMVFQYMTSIQEGNLGGYLKIVNQRR